MVIKYLGFYLFVMCELHYNFKLFRSNLAHTLLPFRDLTSALAASRSVFFTY